MPLVMFVTYSGALGGAEQVLIDFAPALDAECCLACPEGSLAEAARAAGLRVLPLPVRSLDLRTTTRDRLLSAQRLAAHALELRMLVGNLDPDLLVVWGMRSAIAATAAGAPPCPTVFAHNDLLPGPLIGRLVRRAATCADRVIAASHTVAADLDHAGRLSERLIVVHPGVDTERFAPSGAPAEPPEILVLGAMSRMKRPDLALEAYAFARQRRPDLRLRLVGEPVAQDGVRLAARLRERAALADLAGSVEFAGPVEDPRLAISRAACLLHCADREPFGLAVAEALACGRPVVVPAAAGTAEIAEQSCAVLFPPGNAAAAADGLISVLEDPERAGRMGAQGRARIRSHFDRGAARERFISALTPVIRDRRAGGSRIPDQRGAVALLTVTHNSASVLAALLRSVDRHLPGVRTVVVDCASADGTLDVADGRSSVLGIGLRENIGFGRGCNLGIAEIDEPVTVLVNPDVELLDDSLLSLVHEAMRPDRDQRLLAPLVLSEDGTRQDTAHPAPLSLADLARALVPPALIPGRAGVALAPWRAAKPRRVGWAVGCALVARTDTLRRLGPFDERIFLYGEDLDLGLRAAQQGIETWFCPAARVVHRGAHSTGAAFGGEAFEMLARARHDVVAQRLGARRAALDDAAQALTFRSRMTLKRALGRPVERERRQLAALRSLR